MIIKSQHSNFLLMAVTVYLTILFPCTVPLSYICNILIKTLSYRRHHYCIKVFPLLFLLPQSKNASHRQLVQKAPREGLAIPGLSGTHTLPEDFVEEALLISDILELNEMSAVELLLSGEQQMPRYASWVVELHVHLHLPFSNTSVYFVHVHVCCPSFHSPVLPFSHTRIPTFSILSYPHSYILHSVRFPGLTRGLVAVLLYHDGRRSLVASLRSLIQAREGVAWTLGK